MVVGATARRVVPCQILLAGFYYVFCEGLVNVRACCYSLLPVCYTDQTIGYRTSEGDVRLISEENVRQGPARVSANIIFGFGRGKWTLVDTWNQL